MKVKCEQDGETKFTLLHPYCAPEMFAGSKMCARSLSAAARPWRGRWRGTLRPRGGSNMRWMRRVMLCSMHARPFVLRPWTTSWRWERMIHCVHKNINLDLLLCQWSKSHSNTSQQAKQQYWNLTKPNMGNMKSKVNHINSGSRLQKKLRQNIQHTCDYSCAFAVLNDNMFVS